MQIYTIKIESLWHGGDVCVVWKTWVCILTHYWQGPFPHLLVSHKKGLIMIPTSCGCCEDEMQ